MADEGVDRSECTPVMPGGECPSCHWKNGDAEPHPVYPHGGPRVTTSTSLCANCGAPWNLEAARCATCEWLPASDAMVDKLIAEKNTLRHRQGLRPLPPRAMPQEIVEDKALVPADKE